jgi:peptidoglycan/LPS O-acetylase OafA/YrhL
MPLGVRVPQAFSLRANLHYLFVPRRGAVPAATGLRALSMMWVVLHHVQQGLRPLGGTLPGAMFLAHPALAFGWAGNLGIELFFVLSGYLIGGLLMRERETSGSISLGSFYLRRALRILPAYVLAMALNLALPGTDNKESAWANLLFINNFIPFPKQFMAHCWSLAIEEQFFAVVPLSMLLLYRARPARRTLLLAVTVVLAGVIAVAIVWGMRLEVSLRFPNIGEFWRYMDAFYTKPYARFGSLALGILVAKVEQDGHLRAVIERRKHATALLAVLAVAAMLYVMFVFPDARSPSGDRRLLGSVQLALDGYVFAAAAAYLLLVSRTEHWLGRALNTALGARVLHPLAQLSYAIYLFHPILLAPLSRWLGFDLSHPWQSYLLQVAGAFVVSIAAGAVVFLLVELPIMRLRPRLRTGATR